MSNSASSYTAKDIEVLEGLEPVRKRPGMYIGGTDERALHHLVAEVLDNAMDEAVAGFAKTIEMHLSADNKVTITDDGRGIPVDPHPKFKNKSALEVILTTLHSGGKFSNKSYKTAGGLHGVGISVVNALSDELIVTVHRDKKTWQQTFSRGLPTSPLKEQGATRKKGTEITFHPDAEIFSDNLKFNPDLLYQMARSKAYLFKGVKILWSCDPALLKKETTTPQKDELHYPNGLVDFLKASMENRDTILPNPFAGDVDEQNAKIEWAMNWAVYGDDFFRSYCNTIPTPLGGTHESGLRSALTKSIKAYGELTNNKKINILTAEDIFADANILLSAFIPDPQFQGQTKEKLVTASATKLVETAIKDRFEQFLTHDPGSAGILLDHFIERAEERRRKKDERATKRKTATRRLRLPGKLADCASESSDDTEIFIVEGDSAGGSAKQARNRKTQAVLPLRGKILNVASATMEKMMANQELKDLILALGCGIGKDFDVEKLRYNRIVIMTDADVDGAHIAALLMTFFYKQMPGLIKTGHLYLAMPPLYRLTAGGKSMYAMDDAHKDKLLKSEFKSNQKVDISRFKGLGEMPPAQLKETTMDPTKRTLLRVTIPDKYDPTQYADTKHTSEMVERLMGKDAKARFEFIQENAKFVEEIDV